MGITILRPGRGIVAPGVRVMQAGGGSALTPWYLAGGIPLANCKAAYAAKGAASLAASYVNLANPGVNNAAPGVAPTWASATGWTFNGSTQYLTTGVTPSPNWSFIVRFTGATVAGPSTLIGSSNGGDVLFMRPNNGSRHWRYGNAATFGGSAVTSGVMAIAATKAYYNGADEGITLAALTTGTAVWIGGSNTLGSLTIPILANIQAVAIYDITLTAGQNLALYTAIAAL